MACVRCSPARFNLVQRHSFSNCFELFTISISHECNWNGASDAFTNRFVLMIWYWRRLQSTVVQKQRKKYAANLEKWSEKVVTYGNWFYGIASLISISRTVPIIFRFDALSRVLCMCDLYRVSTAIKLLFHSFTFFFVVSFCIGSIAAFFRFEMVFCSACVIFYCFEDTTNLHT